MIDVIIPSARIVPDELQRIGKLPAVIYPVNNRIVFDYLFEQYSNLDTRLHVVAGENSEMIHNLLSKYEASKVDITDLDVVSDLGHTIYTAIKDNQKTVIINFGDTIVLEEIDDKTTDIAFCSVEEVCPTWTYFDEDNGIITKIYDKVSTDIMGKKQLFVGLFRISSPLELKKELSKAFENPCDMMSSFYQAIMQYSLKHPFEFIVTNNWLDIGHEDRYYNSLLEVNAREFNHITIDKERGILKKTSNDTEKFLGEIKWYLKLPEDIEYVRPRIFGYSTSYTNLFVSMEYYAYHTLHELFIYAELSKKQWSDIFERIRFVLNDFSRYHVSGDGIKESLEEMYLNKTLKRFEILEKDQDFKQYFEMPIIVNGVKYKPLREIIEILKAEIPAKLYGIEKFNIIHGDLCFSNILIDDKYSFIKVIDPRGGFGKFDIYGDPRYELAKLFHSIDGKYDYIIKDEFSLLSSGSIIDYKINEKRRDYDLYDLFADAFSGMIGSEMMNVKFIESLLFLSMIPLHGESKSHQIVMLGTGLCILNEVISIICQED